MNMRTKLVARNAGLFAVWAFVMWFGLSAFDLAEKGDSSGSGILSFYVLFTAFGLVVLLDRLWKKPD
jgi:hypothetical protein